jgi:DNA-binding NarL/FixJ family response regulator
MNVPGAGASARPRVLLAEADRPTRAGLRLVLEGGGAEVVGQAADAGTAVAMAVAERPDVALVAAELPGGGILATREITAEVPRVRVVFLTGEPSGEELVAAVLAGAVGYLGRDVDAERLPEILRAVVAGEVALPRRHSQHLVDALRRRDVQRARVAAQTDARFTDREWEVLEMLAADLSTAEIGLRLGISAVTARRHISSLVAKLGVAGRGEAAELLRRSQT